MRLDWIGLDWIESDQIISHHIILYYKVSSIEGYILGDYGDSEVKIEPDSKVTTPLHCYSSTIPLLSLLLLHYFKAAYSTTAYSCADLLPLFEKSHLKPYKVMCDMIRYVIRCDM